MEIIVTKEQLSNVVADDGLVADLLDTTENHLLDSGNYELFRSNGSYLSKNAKCNLDWIPDNEDKLVLEMKKLELPVIWTGHFPDYMAQTIYCILTLTKDQKKIDFLETLIRIMRAGGFDVAGFDNIHKLSKSIQDRKFCEGQKSALVLFMDEGLDHNYTSKVIPVSQDNAWDIIKEKEYANEGNISPKEWDEICTKILNLAEAN